MPRLPVTRRAVLKAPGSSAAPVVPRPRASPAPAAARKGRRQRPSTTAARPAHTTAPDAQGEAGLAQVEAVGPGQVGGHRLDGDGAAEGDLGPVQADGVDRVEQDGTDGRGQRLLGCQGEGGGHREEEGQAGDVAQAPVAEVEEDGQQPAGGDGPRHPGRRSDVGDGHAHRGQGRAGGEEGEDAGGGLEAVGPGPVDRGQGEDDGRRPGRWRCRRSGGSSR